MAADPWQVGAKTQDGLHARTVWKAGRLVVARVPAARMSCVSWDEGLCTVNKVRLQQTAGNSEEFAGGCDHMQEKQTLQHDFSTIVLQLQSVKLSNGSRVRCACSRPLCLGPQGHRAT